jgi:IS30 family transposase
MSYYIQLTQEERYHISVLCKEGFSKTETAKKINRHISTISRELNRNTGKKGYRPKQAHERTLKRRHTSRKAIKFTDKVRQIVDGKISKQFSPDQISGKLRMLGIRISHERIYQYLLDDKRSGGQLYKNLRYSHRKRKKRYGSREKRGQIPNRVSIDKRPKIVDAKERIGDWEADTIIGRNHKGAMVTLVERKSKFTLIRKINRKTSILFQMSSDIYISKQDLIDAAIFFSSVFTVNFCEIEKSLQRQENRPYILLVAGGESQKAVPLKIMLERWKDINVIDGLVTSENIAQNL